MSPSPQLAPPGSSTYDSDTMSVGDGTWDSSRNTFLLPNLMGLNFATMQYNGMRNRFLNMPGYHNLIRGHGIVAAITFLGIVPAAIFMAKFYRRNPRVALRAHIWLQILTVFLTTVVFVLGWFAVGPARSLTNPHHGIGLFIYVAILIQAMGGGIIHRTEKGKERFRLPLKLFLHQWMGRAVAILGFIQVALGLTLYGSPKVLFILYALWGFLLLVLYLGLSFHYRPQSGYYDDATSYFTGYTGTEVTADRRSHRRGHGLGALGAAGAAGAGLAAMRHRSRSRRRSRSRDEVISSRHSSRSPRRSGSVGREKYTEHRKEEAGHTWRNRVLGAGAGIGAIAALRGLFNRGGRKTDDVSDVGSYGPPVVGAGASTFTQTDISRVEEGLAPASPAHERTRRDGRNHLAPGAATAAAAAAVGSPSRRSYGRRRSGASIDSYSSFSDETHRREFGIKEGIAVLGVAGFLKHKLNGRRRAKEDARVEALRQQEIEKEKIARMNSERRRYTGDGAPGPRRGGRRGSLTDSMTDMTGSTPALSRHTLPRPAPAAAAPPMSMASHTNVTETTAQPPKQPRTGHIETQSGSEEYVSSGGRPHRRHHQPPSNTAAVPAAGLAGAAAGLAVGSHRDTSRQRSSADASVNSPPVSVKVKMHEDGRHVTLRRLNEEEAAAERERRRNDRQRRHRGDSMSSLSNGEDRWRRVAATEAAQQQEMNKLTPAGNAPIPLPPPPPGPPPIGQSFSQTTLPDGTLIPPPPPIPGAAAGSAMGNSPAGTGTEMSRTSNFDNNRRRRRAERAREKAERGTGSRVEFT